MNSNDDQPTKNIAYKFENIHKRKFITVFMKAGRFAVERGTAFANACSHTP